MTTEARDVLLEALCEHSGRAKKYGYDLVDGLLAALSEAGLRIVRECSNCGGHGDYADHDRQCPGGGPICEANCPVQVQCAACYGSGVLLYEPPEPKPVPAGWEEPF